MNRDGADAWREHTGQTKYPLALVAGSGLNLAPLLDEVVGAFPIPVRGGALDGHPRRFVLGRYGDRNVIVQEGRFHVYEGLARDDVTRPVAILAAAGVRKIVFTNACGGLSPALEEGHLVGVECMRAWPCGACHAADDVPADFVVPGCDAQGTYYWVQGPSYETRAEIAALRTLGGTVVGMSTLPEVRKAHELGIACAVVSCVTNSCVRPQTLSHEHVVQTAARSSDRLRQLLGDWMAA